MAVRNREVVAAMHVLKLDVQRKILRRRNSMTYNQIAKASGLGENEVSDVLSGKLSNFRAERLLMIASRLGMAPRIVCSNDYANIVDQDGELRPFAAIEVDIIQSAMTICGGDTSKVARLLHIGRATLYRKLRMVKRLARQTEKTCS